jgi:transposase
MPMRMPLGEPGHHVWAPLAAPRHHWTYPAFVDTYHRGSVRGKESTLRRHTHYSTEFRAEAVRLAGASGQSIRQVAMDLGISNESLRRWIALSRERPAGTPLDDDERAELVELRRRVRVLEVEREILRKATAFFAQETERTR